MKSVIVSLLCYDRLLERVEDLVVRALDLVLLEYVDAGVAIALRFCFLFGEAFWFDAFSVTLSSSSLLRRPWRGFLVEAGTFSFLSLSSMLPAMSISFSSETAGKTATQSPLPSPLCLLTPVEEGVVRENTRRPTSPGVDARLDIGEGAAKSPPIAVGIFC